MKAPQSVANGQAEKDAGAGEKSEGQPASRNVSETPPEPGKQWAQAMVLTALYSVPALLCVNRAFVADADIWWHLRTAEWIVQHGAVPHTDPFSSFGAGKPWAAYSWLYELLMLQLFQRLGLAGLVVYMAGMVALITAALHRLNRRLQHDFTIAVLLTFAGSLCLASVWTPRSWLFTILFFVFEIDVLMQARRTGKARELLWLPLVFALWANLHIQFVVGLLALAAAAGECVLARFWNGIQTRIPLARLCIISILCLLATLVNPYGWHVYQVAYDLASQPGVVDKLVELQALPFRGLQDYGVLFIALAAAGVLARARRAEVFEIAMFAFAVLVSFRSQRDVWVVVAIASAILAQGLKLRHSDRFQITAMAAPLIAIATVLVVFLGFKVLPVSDNFLQAKLQGSMPVRAAEFVKQKGLSGPLYNDYGWGGYLIWKLGMPVSMDGRANVYGDAPIARSAKTWDGGTDWASDPDLLKANLVIGPASAPLTQLLRMSQRFDLAYEDKVAVVFVARKSPAAAAGCPPVGK
jgi:hypothetical protein